ncbi:hypothetical protein FKM82_008780 [Ascaphus truei]
MQPDAVRSTIRQSFVDFTKRALQISSQARVLLKIQHAIPVLFRCFNIRQTCLFLYEEKKAAPSIKKKKKKKEM